MPHHPSPLFPFRGLDTGLGGEPRASLSWPSHRQGMHAAPLMQDAHLVADPSDLILNHSRNDDNDDDDDEFLTSSRLLSDFFSSASSPSQLHSTANIPVSTPSANSQPPVDPAITEQAIQLQGERQTAQKTHYAFLSLDRASPRIPAPSRESAERPGDMSMVC
jgi:hypothetical protein